MKITKESRRISRELFRMSFTDARLDAGKARNIVRVLIEEKPRHFTEVLKEYHRLIRLEVQKRHAVIESATPLDLAMTASVTRSLQSRHGSDITTEFRTNPSLVGGLRVRLGSNVWDGSVRNRLDRLRQDFTNA